MLFSGGCWFEEGFYSKKEKLADQPMHRFIEHHQGHYPTAPFYDEVR
jgi:hypothetical protein